MKYTYNCTSCKEKNFVDVNDLFTMGMGRDGISASEFGFGPVLGSGGLFSGFPGRGPSRSRSKEIIHYCYKCKEKNLITLD